MKDECKYRLPCGWCDRQNKRCEMTIKSETETNVKKVVTSETDSAITAISAKPKRCGTCDRTDGMCYMSNPPKVKCTLTGRFHFYDDECDVQGTITAKN